jgi:SanA protein
VGAEHRSQYITLGLDAKAVTDSTRRRVAGRRRRRVGRRIIAAVLVLLAGLLFVLGAWLRTQTKYGGRVYEAGAAVPSRPVAIVFGAGLTADGAPSAVLEDRVRTAADLYRAGTVRKLLLSGDNSRKEYDEASAMKRLAIEAGVAERDLVLDYAGFRTYDTCYRARDIFGVRAAVLVTQRYHLPRALYLANELGIDAVGVEADRRAYVWGRAYRLREVAACVLAWIDVHLTRPKPHFLGQPAPIEP